MSKEDEKNAAAKQRDDYLRALDEELDQVKRAGKDARVEAVKAEIARVKKVGHRTPPPQAKAADV